MKSLARLMATLGPVCYATIAPASGCSALVTLAGWFIPPPALPVTIALLAIGTALAIWVCGEAEKQLGHDAKPIVADEVVGQSLALLAVPHTPVAFAISLLLFRVFDVWKPLGAHQAQSLPGGFGVVADDVIAGLTACGVFHLGAWVGHLAGWVC